MTDSPYFSFIVIFLLYYLLGLGARFGLLAFQKDEWFQKISSYFHIVSPHLFKVFFISLLGGLIFIWIPTLLNLPAKTIVSQAVNFISSFSFAILVSSLQGWLLIKGFDVIGKYHLPQKSLIETTKNPENIVQPIIYFLGFILVLSVIFDFLLTFFISYLTS